MNTKYMVVIAAMAVMLIGATAFATDSAFAGGHGHKKSYRRVRQSHKSMNVATDGWQRMSDVKTLHPRFRAMKTE